MSSDTTPRTKDDKDPEAVEVQENIGSVYRPEVDTSGIDEKQLMRRIDWHVVPWLALLYLLNFLDRGNIGNAKVSHPYLLIDVTQEKAHLPRSYIT